MIPVNEPLLNGNEEKYLLEAVRTGWISSEGPAVKKFEELFAARMGRKYGIAVCNGTAAIEALVQALRLPEGSEVIVPALTIISCVAPLVRAGLVPVVVDADPRTWNMKVEDVEGVITPKTRAIMAVHLYGLPVDMGPLLQVAEKHGLIVIEDAAEAIGQTYKGRPCGSFGAMSAFSFYPNKHVTTGEGGMILTDDAELAERCRSVRNLCFLPERRFVHEELGYNFRMTNLQAALGLAQLERLDEFLEKKRKIGHWYDELLSNVDGFELPVRSTGYAENLYWVYGLVIKDEVPYEAEAVMKRLGKKGIGTRPFFWPIHEQPVLRRMGFFEGVSCPVAERLGRRGFYIPSGLGLTEEQGKMVAEAVREVLG